MNFERRIRAASAPVSDHPPTEREQDDASLNSNPRDLDSIRCGRPVADRPRRGNHGGRTATQGRSRRDGRGASVAAEDAAQKLADRRGERRAASARLAHALQRLRGGVLPAARYSHAVVRRRNICWPIGNATGCSTKAARKAGGRSATKRLSGWPTAASLSWPRSRTTIEHFHGGHGHIALIRPSTKSAAQVAKEGPQITQAGGHNYNSAPLNKGFAQQVIDRHQVLFFAYKP